MRKRLGALAVVLGAACPLAPWAFAGASTTAATATPYAWFDKGLNVVGGPVASGSMFVVLVSGANQSLSMDGVVAKSGVVAWHVPVTRSYAVAGAYSPPAVADGVALALEPASGYQAGAARIVGIDVATGRRAWYQPAVVLATDFPETCLGAKSSKKGFCIPVVVGKATQPSLAIFDPTDGVLVGHQTNVARALDFQLFELNGSPDSLAELGVGGKVLWKATVASLTGSAKYSAGYGWAFNNVNGIEVGDIGSAPSGTNFPLGAGLVFAVRPDGKVAWRHAGSYLCDPLVAFTSSFLCTGSGTYAYDPKTLHVAISTGATEMMHGFNPSTGAFTWQFALKNVSRFVQIGGVPLGDAFHVIVEGQRGTVLLDLRSGSTATPGASAVFWCPHFSRFSVPNTPAQTGGSVSGTPQFSACRADGSPATGAGPINTIVGATAGGIFAWPSPTGFASVRA